MPVVIRPRCDEIGSAEHATWIASVLPVIREQRLAVVFPRCRLSATRLAYQ